MNAPIVQADTPALIEAARGLFREYAASLAFSLDYQGFDKELATLPGKYGPPAGRLLLALDNEAATGCVALRPLRPGICELKRLYVRPACRGRGFGRRLCERLLAEARAIGYGEMWLDSERDFEAAVSLYRALGFQEIPRYNDDPNPETVYLGLEL